VPLYVNKPLPSKRDAMCSACLRATCTSLMSHATTCVPVICFFRWALASTTNYKFGKKKGEERGIERERGRNNLFRCQFNDIMLYEYLTIGIHLKIQGIKIDGGGPKKKGRGNCEGRSGGRGKGVYAKSVCILFVELSIIFIGNSIQNGLKIK
jgi:hypothetical protein